MSTINNIDANSINEQMELAHERLEEDTNVIPINRPSLRLIHGGGGVSGDWLGQLPVGAVLLSRPIPTHSEPPSALLMLSKVVWKQDTIVILEIKGEEHWVLTPTFSMQNEKIGWRMDDGHTGHYKRYASPQPLEEKDD